jgi:hypothetical protein
VKRTPLNLECRAPSLLVAAALFVALAIDSEDGVARVLNTMGGILWLLSAWLLWRANARHAGRSVPLVAATTALVLVIALRPSNLIWAGVGFAIGGAIVALAVSGDRVRAALMLPALWLPVHLLVAITKVGIREIRDRPATVRTDPPPTAAFVPLAMVLASMFGAWAIGKIVERRLTSHPEAAQAN